MNDLILFIAIRRAILERKDTKKTATKTAGEDVEMVDVSVRSTEYDL